MGNNRKTIWDRGNAKNQKKYGEMNLAFSIEFMAIGVVIFFSGYFAGWWVRGRWEAKLKPMFLKEKKKNIAKKIKSKNPHWNKKCIGCVDEFRTDPSERWCMSCVRSLISTYDKREDKFKEREERGKKK